MPFSPIPQQQPSDSTLALAQTLLRFDTTSRNSNLPLIEYAHSYLQQHHVPCRITYNEDRTKANLLAIVGAGKPAGIILSGHTDVVPTDGQAWTVDPFGGLVRDGKLYGRGSCDMKGFIAACLNMVPFYLEQELPHSIYLALSYDEEVGCFGARELIADMKEAGIAPLACIVGEPTDMVPAIAHKGVFRYRCCVRGKEAHSSQTPLAVNAIEYAASVIHELRNLATELERNEQRYAGFEVPYTTSSVGVIHGGIADNVVPRDCVFHYEFRNLPHTDALALNSQVKQHAAKLQAQMQQVHPQAGVSFETICEVPAFEGSAASPVTALAQRLSGNHRTALVGFGTEAGLFQSAGVDTVVCGPGSISQAHQPDEYVTLEQLAQCEHFLQQLGQLHDLITTLNAPAVQAA